MDYFFRKHDCATARHDEAIGSLLTARGLVLEDDTSVVISMYEPGGSILGVGGIAGDTLKCVAVTDTPDAVHERELFLPLMTELVATAWEIGEKDLLLYCSPDRMELFCHCGFAALAVVPGLACLMENNRQRLPEYKTTLAASRHPGDRIASLFMECGPFTLGHRALAEKAASENDWVHIFLRKDTVNFFSHEDRLEMTRRGVADLPNITVHPASVYAFSRDAFPGFFIHDEKIRAKARVGIEAQLFRKHIAPALGITCLYTGSAPLAEENGRVNADLATWLKTETVDAPPLELVQVPRFQIREETLCASTVRALMATRGLDAIRSMIPESSYLYIRDSLHSFSATLPPVQPEAANTPDTPGEPDAAPEKV